MTQSIEYVVKVAGTQQAATQIGTVEHALEKTEVQARRAGAAIDTAVKPTRNLGQAGLEASRAIEDLQYGIGGVVNNIPSLVMALGGGAGLTAAISLAAVGVNQLYKEFSAVPDATETATTTARKYIEDLRGEIADLGKELRLVQIGATGVAMEEQRKRIQIAMVEARAVVDAVGGPERLARLRELTGDRPEMLPSRGMGPLANRNYVSPEAFQAAIDAQTKIDLEIRKMQQIQLIELEKADKEGAEKRGRESGRRYIEGVITAMSDPRSEALAGMFSQAGLRSTVAGNIAEREMEAEIEQEAIRARWEEEAQRRREKANEDMINAALARDQRIAANEEMFANMRYEAEKQRLQEIADLQMHYATMGFGVATDAAGSYLDAVITGQENAEAMLGATLMRTAGQALVGHGVNLAGAATVSAFTGLLPLAAAQGGAAAGLIAGGLALGASATGIEHVAAGGSIGKALPTDRASKDPGASPRTNSGGSSGGPMIINVSYGAGGPLPEDVAREIERVMSSGNRRRGAA